MGDNELNLLIDGVLAHPDELFQLKTIGAKADVFHILFGTWKTPAERCFMWLGGFRSSELLKAYVQQLESSRLKLTQLELRYKRQLGASPILKPPPKATNVTYSNKDFSEFNSSNVSLIDELEEFAMGKMQNNATRKANINIGDTKRNLAAKIKNNKGVPAAR
ncbi:transcription factor TGA2-like isoform [Arachis hypogaea]|nr:transcription factor TGA2-like isoform [Arachis hypogaea]